MNWGPPVPQVGRGGDISGLGSPEDALAASQETADIRGHLVANRADTFLSDLARNLGALSQALASARRPRGGSWPLIFHKSLMKNRKGQFGSDSVSM
jgi:hypothetical protein